MRLPSLLGYVGFCLFFLPQSAFALEIENYRAVCERFDDRADPECKRRDYYALAWRDPRDVVTGFQSFKQITGWLWINRNTTAQSIKTSLARMPQGRRAIYIEEPQLSSDSIPLNAHPLDQCGDGFHCIPWNHGIAAARDRHDRLFKELSDLGVEIDTVVIDFEDAQQLESRQLSVGGFIGANVARGLAQWEHQPFLDGLFIRAGHLAPNDFLNSSGTPVWENIYIWTEVMSRQYFAEAMDEAVMAPIRKYYPKALTSNYNMAHHLASRELRDFNGHADYAVGNGGVVGNQQALELYNNIGQYWGANAPPIERTDFNEMKKDVQFTQSSSLASDVPLAPWIAFLTYSFQASTKGMYAEEIYHIIMNSKKFSYFNYWNPYNGLIKEHLPYHGDDPYLESALQEATRMIGYQKVRPLFRRMMTLSEVVTNDHQVSQVIAGKRKVTRITTDGANINVSRDYVKKIGRNTYVIGRKNTCIFRDAQVVFSKASPNGIWIVQEESAPTPIVREN